MSVTEIEKTIEPLSRAEKLQLIADITRMLQQEEQNVSDFFDPGKVYEVATPNIANDDSAWKAAQALKDSVKGQTI